MINTLIRYSLFCILAATVMFSILYVTYSPRVITIYMHEPINDSMALPIIKQIKSATSSDVIVLDISTPGGSTFAMHSIMVALDQTKAYKVAVVRSLAASAGAYIMCKADVAYVSDVAAILWHVAATPAGKITAYSANTPMEKIIVEGYKYDDISCMNYITADWQFRVSIGEDMWISGKQLKAASGAVKDISQFPFDKIINW